MQSMPEQTNRRGHRRFKRAVSASLIACELAVMGAFVGLRAKARDERADRSGWRTSDAARITRVQIDRVVSPAFGGREFGTVGRYEDVHGQFSGELDPTHPQNALIIDIDRAPRNAEGMVEYSADFRLLRPIDTTRGNQTLLYDVLNRGSKRIFYLNQGWTPGHTDDPGDGFLMQQGYTIVWSGWAGDLIETEAGKAGDGLVARLPIATHSDGRRISRWRTVELPVSKAGPTARFEQELYHPYPAGEENMSQARLYRRSNQHATPELIPRDQWSFAMCDGSGPPVPSHIHVCLPAGFSTNALYDLVYEAQDPIVMGIGLAAIRDFVSFLRYNTTTSNPLRSGRRAMSGDGPPVKRVIIFGNSQSARPAKDFVYRGFNRDTAGRPVVDGLIASMTGSRRLFLNQEFSTPSRVSEDVTTHYTPEDQFPFSYITMTDPLSGKADGLLVQCQLSRTCPKIMQWDSGSDFWNSRGSLVLTDPTGTNDVAPLENVRYYFFASSQHLPPDGPPSRGICQYLNNPNPIKDTQRALLVAMQAWVADGTLPPPSQHPKISDGTLVPPLPQASVGFPAIPGVRYVGKPNDAFLNDYMAMPPSHTTFQYGIRVPKVDADGNDIAGVRSVAVQVPIASYASWNLRRAGFIENEHCTLEGSYFPFARRKADRRDDPRPSLEERYGTHETYVARVRAAAEHLRKARLLLPQDAARIIREAEQQDVGLPRVDRSK
jgi:hypothetical protein